jgi:hypothetical protein
MESPLVILLDIDGTLIGEILPQVIEWQLVSTFRKEFLRSYKLFLIDALKTELLRPGFSNFFHKLESLHIEFFIYTASESKWANYLVPCIESACNVKFNRPVFTREHMVFETQKNGDSYHMKSIEKILPLINKTLAKKGWKIPATISQCMIIDNNYTLVSNELKRVAKCSSYKSIFPFDMLRFIPSTMIMENKSEIISHLNHLNLLPEHFAPSTINEFYHTYHYSLGKFLQKASTQSKYDITWNRLNKQIVKYLSTKKRKDFKETFIKDLKS